MDLIVVEAVPAASDDIPRHADGTPDFSTIDGLDDDSDNELEYTGYVCRCGECESCRVKSNSVEIDAADDDMDDNRVKAKSVGIDAAADDMDDNVSVSSLLADAAAPAAATKGGQKAQTLVVKANQKKAKPLAKAASKKDETVKPWRRRFKSPPTVAASLLPATTDKKEKT